MIMASLLDPGTYPQVASQVVESVVCRLELRRLREAAQWPAGGGSNDLNQSLGVQKRIHAALTLPKNVARTEQK